MDEDEIIYMFVVNNIRNFHSYFEILESEDEPNFVQSSTGNASQAALSVVIDKLVNLSEL